MKKPIVAIILCFISSLAIGQNLSIKNQKIVRNFTETVKTKNSEKISNIVSCPLTREYPIPDVKNQNEFTARFDQVFDDKLISLIVKSKIKTDWSEVGWRGIMLKNGEVWIDYDGKLIVVNYQSLQEKEEINKLIEEDKNQLHESLKIFKRPICILETCMYKIRIDDLGNNKYRYAFWKLPQSMNEKPEVVLVNGKVSFDGSGGNHSCIFKSGDYIYECAIIEMGEDDAPPAYLTVTKGDKEILSQDAQIKK